MLTKVVGATLSEKFLLYNSVQTTHTRRLNDNLCRPIVAFVRDYETSVRFVIGCADLPM